jgi:ubiquitin-protein ligase
MNTIWFLHDLTRLHKERQLIETIQFQSEWLQGVEWTLEGAELVLLATIETNNQTYPVKMVYPTHFPAVPPTVYPQDTSQHWSVHQYSNGALCLEWRPDTWHSDLSGADLLTSAYSLLQQEAISEGIEHTEVPSQHTLSLGQELRFNFLRLLADARLPQWINSALGERFQKFHFSINCPANSLIIFIKNIITENENILWEENYLPCHITTLIYPGLVFNKRLPKNQINGLKTSNDLRKIVDKYDDWLAECINLDKQWTGILFLDEDNDIHFFLLRTNEPDKIWKSEIILCGMHGENVRLPANFFNIQDLKVGIIGLGSVGSKVAVSLARSGIKNFYLVDHDILLPENLCRNQLEWWDVGEHKVHTVKKIIQRILPSTNIEISIFNIGGQESNSALENILRKLSQSDLIIDTTANPEAFNLLSYSAKQHGIPMVWGEVLAGGIGALAARYRPSYEPSPQSMRSAFYEYLSLNKATFSSLDSRPYSGDSDSTDTLTATDADVSILAGYLTQIALDILLDKNSQRFPYSMYILGFQKSWVFSEPFNVIPIDLSELEFEVQHKEISPDIEKDALSFLEDIIVRRKGTQPAA